jgi:branched-chain amino acid transport system substrate-binding protein
VNHRLRRWPAGAPVLPFVLTVLFACSPGDRPIRIGLAGPFSDSVGAPMRHAAELAVREINSAGGIGGRPIELIVRDDFGDPDSAVSVAEALAAADVVAVIGHVYSGTTLAAAPVYNGARSPVVQISPSSSAPAVTHAGAYTFRTCPSDLQQGAALARFAADRLGLRRGTILYLNDEYGRGIRTTFANEFARRGGMLDEIDPYLGPKPAVDPFIERLARRRTSQFIFLGGNLGEAAEVLRIARARGVTVPMLGGHALEGLEEIGRLADDTYISNAYLPSFETPKNRAFVRAYARAFPVSLHPNQPAAATYDIVYLLREVIARVGTSRPKIRAAVAAFGRSSPPFEGVTGEIAFDENGDVPRQRVIIGRVEGGEVRAVEGL